MYLHKKTPVLEQPSELSRKTVEFKLNESFTFGAADEKRLGEFNIRVQRICSLEIAITFEIFIIFIISLFTVSIKKSEGLPVAEDTEPKLKLKKKKKKQPNPLSCKKKKKKNKGESSAPSKKSTIDTIQNKTIEKKKRKRIKIPTHIKDMLQSNKQNQN